MCILYGSIFSGRVLLVFGSDAAIWDGLNTDQNYKNPDKAGTRIKYRVPFKENGVKSLVGLKIFHILGHEIITLVNEEKAPGNYEVDFNAQSLASGVCICRMKPGSFMKLNEMILMKIKP